MLSCVTPKQRLLLCKPVSTGLNVKDTLPFLPSSPALCKANHPDCLYNRDVGKVSASDNHPLDDTADVCPEKTPLLP